MLKNAVMVYLFSSVPLTMFFCSYVLMRSKVAYMKYFFVLSLAVSLYAFGYLMELNSHTLEQMIFWNQIQYLGVPFTSTLWFIVALLYTKRVPTLKRWMLALLFAIPVLTFIIRLTNSSHHLFYTSMYLQQVADYSYLYLDKGPLYYVQSGYHLLMMVGITLLFYKEYKAEDHLKRTRSILLLVSSLVPYLGLILILTDFRGWGLDYSILLFPISLLLIMLAITRYDFLEIRSLARGEIFENAAEAMLLLDMEYWIMDFNRAARAFFKSYDIEIQNGVIEFVLKGNRELIALIKTGKTKVFEGPNDRIFEITTRIMKDYRGNDLSIIKGISDITKRKKIHEQLERMATIDELSLLNNRRHFMELAEKEFKRAYRYNESFCVLMIDIDRFKEVNDSRGHAAGNVVIQTMGKLMLDRFRKTDILGRLGGEEFAVLLLQSSVHEAQKVAEELRQRVAGTEIEYGDEPIKVTISIGISAFIQKVESFERILQHADEALYQAKANGRNQISLKELKPRIR